MPAAGKFRPLLSVLVLLLSAPTLNAAGTPGSTTPDAPPAGEAAESQALTLHRSGIEAKELAWQAEARAAQTTDPQAKEALIQEAQSHYRQAADAQGAALKIDPRYAEAANELGYALRRAGDYRKALGAYNYALMLKPDFLEAVEYRGEALLGIGDLDGAKAAYLRLFREAPELGERLLSAMETWLEQQVAESAQLQAFGDWVEERRVLETATREVSQASVRHW
ncbi:MAG: tetratricopeptide repeat protein [Pseudomonadales bacterium]